MRKARKSAEAAEAQADRVMREVILPLRRLREKDFVSDAVVDDILRRKSREV